jgi:hypothetical protein
MKPLKLMMAAAALLLSCQSMAQELSFEAQYGADSDVLTAHPVLGPVAVIQACAKQWTPLQAGPRSFEKASSAVALKALNGSGDRCWTRLGPDGDKGYAEGNVRVVSISQNTNGDGTSTAYDVYVGATKVGTAMRVVATEKPFFYGLGEVVANGAGGSTVRFGDGTEVVVPHQARQVGTRAAVYAIFSNGSKAFSYFAP